MLLLLPGFAAAQPVLLVQHDLADLRLSEVTGLDWSTVSRDGLSSRFCAAAASTIAVTSHGLSRRERDACPLEKGGKLIEKLIGRRAVLAMTGGMTFSLTPPLLYRALARKVAGPDGEFAINRAAHWRDLDPALPNAPIRVLLPPPDSVESRIVSDITLYDGCAAVAGSALPRNPAKRLALCTTLRTDTAVARASDEVSASDWLHSEGGAAVALIGVATLLAEPELETALPLDGVTPSFATIADGSYHAALPVWLLTVVTPNNAQSIAGVAGPLLAESAIGPLGKLPRHGLAPLLAADRVKLRASLGEAFKNAGD